MELLLPGRPVMMTTSRAMVETIVANLMGNAVRYSREGAEGVGAAWWTPASVVRLIGRRRGHRHRRPRTRRRIFEEFYRTTAAQEVSDLGTGLGLAIVKRYVDRPGRTHRGAQRPGPGRDIHRRAAPPVAGQAIAVQRGRTDRERQNASSCGGMMERRDVCLVEVLGFDWRPGQACGILGKFGQGRHFPELPEHRQRARGRQEHVVLREHGASGGAAAGSSPRSRPNSSPPGSRSAAPWRSSPFTGPISPSGRTWPARSSARCAWTVSTPRRCARRSTASRWWSTLLDRDHTVACLKQKFEWPE